MKDIDYFKRDPGDTVYPEEEKLQRKIEKKHDKFKKNARLRDVRRALLGNLEIGEDSCLKPCDGLNLNWWGTADGSFGTRFFGIAHRSVTLLSLRHAIKLFEKNISPHLHPKEKSGTDPDE